LDFSRVAISGVSSPLWLNPSVQVPRDKARFLLRQDIELSHLYPTVFVFYPEAALWSVEVNGHQVAARGLPLSISHHVGRSIDLAPFLHPGVNSIQCDMEAYWGQASLTFYISPWDKYSLIFSAFVLLATLATIAFFSPFVPLSIPRAEGVILLGGFLLRYLYLLGTPYFVRSYDWWGHGGYIDYVAQYLSLPDPRIGWESYQPPLYYFLVGGLTKLLLFCGMADDQRYCLWQAVSLICSTAMLATGFWIVRSLYGFEPGKRNYLLVALAVAPPLVFNASRVSNDTLVNLLAFFWLALLLQFWRQPNWRTWLGLSVIVGLALLTKANALVFAPISLLCLFLTRNLELRSKIHLSIMLAAVTTVMAGWYYVPRAFTQSGVDTYVISTIQLLNVKAHIDGVFGKSLVFNPFKILRYPFVEVWGPRNEYFPEYFFKSMLLGDWYLGHYYRWMARALMVPPLLLIPPFLFGFWRSLKMKTTNDLPIVVTFLAVFLAHWTFLQFAPFICHQDFRFSEILIVPITYFVLQGASTLPAKWESACRFLLQLTFLNAAIYLLELALEG
jgi:hypothetical protein